MRLYISNFRKMICLVVSCVIIVSVCGVVLKKCFEITWRPRQNLFYFYQLQDNSIDVLNVGSSHVYCSVNTVELYRSRGIASYNLAAGAQPVWFSYYYLKEALKTQTPKVVLLDVYTMYNPDDNAFTEFTQGNLLTLKPSKDKLDAIRISGCSPKDYWNLLWGFPKNHARYREVTKEEYINEPCRNMMGYNYMPAANPIRNEDVLDVRMIEESIPVSEKAEEYLRKSIELCKAKNISIVLINSPYADIDEESAKRFNYVEKIAEEYGIDFIDGCRMIDKIGIDYLKDNGEDGHLCYSGSLKWTKEIGDYLAQNYDLPDYRIEKPKVWEESVKVLENILVQEHLKTLRDAKSYYEYVERETNLPYLVIEESDDTDNIAYYMRRLDSTNVSRSEIYSDRQLYESIYEDLLKNNNHNQAYKRIMMQYNAEIADKREGNSVFFVVFDPFSYQPLDMAEYKETEE